MIITATGNRGHHLCQEVLSVLCLSHIFHLCVSNVTLVNTVELLLGIISAWKKRLLLFRKLGGSLRAILFVSALAAAALKYRAIVYYRCRTHHSWHVKGWCQLLKTKHMCTWVLSPNFKHPYQIRVFKHIVHTLLDYITLQ